MHDCKQEETIGIFKEFMNNTKGMRTAIYGIITIIVIQIGSFLVMWGEIRTTVKYHGTAIDNLCKKLDNVQIVGYVRANPTSKEEVK